MLRETFLEDSKLFHESFYYGVHFVITERTSDGYKMLRLRKNKKRLVADDSQNYFLPTGILMANDTYQVGDWIYGNETDKKIVGKKIFTWEVLGQFTDKDGVLIKNFVRMLKKGISIELGDTNAQG